MAPTTQFLDFQGENPLVCRVPVLLARQWVQTTGRGKLAAKTLHAVEAA